MIFDGAYHMGSWSVAVCMRARHMNMSGREQTCDSDPFLIYYGFSHPHNPRNGTPELLRKYGATNHKEKENPPKLNPEYPPTTLKVNFLPTHPIPPGHVNLRDEDVFPGFGKNAMKPRFTMSADENAPVLNIWTFRSARCTKKGSRWQAGKYLCDLYSRSRHCRWTPRLDRQTKPLWAKKYKCACRVDYNAASKWVQTVLILIVPYGCTRGSFMGFKGQTMSQEDQPFFHSLFNRCEKRLATDKQLGPCVTKVKQILNIDDMTLSFFCSVVEIR